MSERPRWQDPADVQWSSASVALVRVRQVLAACWFGTLLVAAVTTALVWDRTWPWVVAGAAAVLWAWTAWLVPRQVRALGYAERSDDLLVRKGILQRELTVIPYGRMQTIDVEAGPLARRAKIATVQLHTASSDTDAEIPGVPEDVAAALRDRLAARGEARMVGL